MGLTNRQVLAAATHNFSLIWNWTHIGKIEQGGEADILILQNNPLNALEELKNIELLMVDGEIIDHKTLIK
jgi:imidazolonepropionase-like amidohydrolase